jgi:hypothetical protein
MTMQLTWTLSRRSTKSLQILKSAGLPVLNVLVLVFSVEKAAFGPLFY